MKERKKKEKREESLKKISIPPVNTKKSKEKRGKETFSDITKHDRINMRIIKAENESNKRLTYTTPDAGHAK